MKNKYTLRLKMYKFLSSGWNLLSLAAFCFIPGGILLILLSWHPTAGPYVVGERYPYGGYLEAWQVSMGFAFVAFGFLFVGAILTGGRLKSRGLWAALLAGFILFWFPHFWMGITFFLYDPTLANLGTWGIYLPFILLWMVIVIVGFILAWKEIQRESIRKVGKRNTRYDANIT